MALDVSAKGGQRDAGLAFEDFHEQCLRAWFIFVISENLYDGIGGYSRNHKSDVREGVDGLFSCYIGFKSLHKLAVGPRIDF